MGCEYIFHPISLKRLREVVYLWLGMNVSLFLTPSLQCSPKRLLPLCHPSVVHLIPFNWCSCRESLVPMIYLRCVHVLHQHISQELTGTPFNKHRMMSQNPILLPLSPLNIQCQDGLTSREIAMATLDTTNTCHANGLDLDVQCTEMAA